MRSSLNTLCYLFGLLLPIVFVSVADAATVCTDGQGVTHEISQAEHWRLRAHVPSYSSWESTSACGPVSGIDPVSIHWASSYCGVKYDMYDDRNSECSGDNTKKRRFVINWANVPDTCENGELDPGETAIDEGPDCAYYPDSPYREPFCSNGVQDAEYGETAIDCGGPCGSCTPVFPANCSNGVTDADEVGVDCGGSCGDCQSWCPDNTEALTGPDGVSRCYAVALADKFGNCPVGWTKGADAFPGDPGVVGTCFKSSDTYLGYQDPNLPDVPNPWTAYTAQYSTTSDTRTVDNGDGTETSTTVSTTTGPNDATKITTTTTTTNTTTGEVIGETIEETESLPEGANPAAYDGQIVSANEYDGTPDEVTEDDVPGLLNSFVENSPIFAMLNTFEVRTSAADPTVDPVDVYGTDIGFDFTPWQSHLQTFGAILLAICQGYAVLVIFKGW